MNGEPLKQLSLAELGNAEVTTTSKEPEEVWRTAPARLISADASARYRSSS